MFKGALEPLSLWHPPRGSVIKTGEIASARAGEGSLAPQNGGWGWGGCAAAVPCVPPQLISLPPPSIAERSRAGRARQSAAWIAMCSFLRNNPPAPQPFPSAGSDFRSPARGLAGVGAGPALTAGSPLAGSD